jgi:hypothetical protein
MTSPLHDLMPKNRIIAMAWVGSLRYALGRKDIVDVFRRDTGNEWVPPTNPVDQMIDAGRELDFLRAFAKWHNENIWGEDEGNQQTSTVGA